jgi:hypothetical protein
MLADSEKKEAIMAKFSILNPRSRGKSAPNTVNFEGGRAFTQTAKLELVSVLLTTFLEDEFYRTEKQTTEKIRELITKVGDPRFVAKAALYARNIGHRTVKQACALRSVDVVPAKMTSPPSRFTASTFTAAAVSGMTTTARVRWYTAAQVIAWPWLPDE